MQISKNNNVNIDTRNQKARNPLAFGAKLIINPRNIKFRDLEDVFERVTNEIKGDVILDDIGGYFNFSYIDAQGKNYTRKTCIMVEDLAENQLDNENQPFTCAIRRILANGEDLLAKNGLGRGEKNPFVKSFNELSFPQLFKNKAE